MTSADLAGLNIRVPGNPARVALFESLGAAPTQINIDAFSFFEKQSYLSLTAHIYSPVYLAMNEDSWQQLSPEVQQGLETAASAASVTSRNAGAEADEQLLAKFEEAGVPA